MRLVQKSSKEWTVFNKLNERCGLVQHTFDLSGLPVFDLFAFEPAEALGGERAWRAVHQIIGGTKETAGLWLANRHDDLVEAGELEPEESEDRAIDSYEARLEGIAEER